MGWHKLYIATLHRALKRLFTMYRQACSMHAFIVWHMACICTHACIYTHNMTNSKFKGRALPQLIGDLIHKDQDLWALTDNKSQLHIARLETCKSVDSASGMVLAPEIQHGLCQILHYRWNRLFCHPSTLS